jgi:hypothetical protein
MQSEIPFLTPEDVARIQTFCSIAKMKDAPISLSELLALASLDMNEDELTRAWRNSKTLNGKYAITTSGLVTETGESDFEIQKEKSERAERAFSNISWAEKFCDYLDDKQLKTLAISGSTSYLSVSRNDDLDLFYVTKKDTLWIGFTRALLKARLFRLKEKNVPWICLSYVADEDFIEREISENRNPIIARDALSAKIVRGDSYFNDLLRRNDWMAEYFPKIYEQRIRRSATDNLSSGSKKRFGVLGEKLVNTSLYYAVGTYIRIKSGLLNRKLKRTRRDSSVFRLRIGKDHCIYESESYQEMKRMYSREYEAL